MPFVICENSGMFLVVSLNLSVGRQEKRGKIYSISHSKIMVENFGCIGQLSKCGIKKIMVQQCRSAAFTYVTHDDIKSLNSEIQE